MPLIPRLLVLVAFGGMIASLGSALIHISRNSAESSRKMGRAFLWRIAISIALFVLLMLAWAAGLIAPHPMVLPGAPGQ
jgi:threonine/homoserine/homoserine lactone efflux protein